MKRSPLRRMSDKQRAALKVYGILKREYFANHSLCQFEGCFFTANHIHHTRGRSGRKLNETRYWLALCCFHHEWIHAHAREARKLGYIKF